MSARRDGSGEGGRGEDELIGWLRGHLGDGSPIGDDAALLDERTAITVDHQIEGVHFPTGTDPATVARRLLAVNLSDLAAVGAEPRQALLALATAPGFDHRRFFRALTAACARHGVTLAGGDLAGLPGSGGAGSGPGLVASLTLLGELPEGGAWVRRRGARPGDALWVGGTLGESALGRHLVARGARLGDELPASPPPLPPLPPSLAAAARRAVRRHLLPEPQLELGRALGRRAAGGIAHPPAALDVSDGLAVDLARLCRASGVGADVSLPALPRAAGSAALAAHLELDVEALALGGGEDYVLLFTWPAPTTQNAPEGCTRIGTITAAPGALRGFDGGFDERGSPLGESRPLPLTGWDHLTG